MEDVDYGCSVWVLVLVLHLNLLRKVATRQNLGVDRYMNVMTSIGVATACLM
jgi:hypothetical protein